MGVNVTETTVYLFISVAVKVQQCVCVCVSGEVVAVLCAFTEPRPSCLHHIMLQKRTDAIVSSFFFFFRLSSLHLPKPSLTSGDDVIPPQAPPLPLQLLLLSVGRLFLQATQQAL